MKMFNFLLGLKRKSIEPKLFIFLLEGYNFRQLVGKTGYEYDEIERKVREDFKKFLEDQHIKKKNQSDGFFGMATSTYATLPSGEVEEEKILMGNIKVTFTLSFSVMDAFGEYLTDDADEHLEKNAVMARILQKKDVTLIDKYKDILSEKDRAYLLDKIAK